MRKYVEETFYVLSIVSLLFTENFAQRDLRLLGLLPMTGDSWTGGTACLPAVEMAVKDVNADDSILKNYKLVYNWIDSKVIFFTISTKTASSGNLFPIQQLLDSNIVEPIMKGA